MVLLQPQTFHWRKDVTPWSSPAAVGLSIGSYLILVFGLRSILKHQVRVPVWITALHNLILCGWSLLLFIGTLSESIKESFSIGGGTWLFCLPKGTAVQGALYYWSYMYYLSKYYEFVDTILLVLKGKPLTVLHVFHHSVVVVMAWLWLDQAQSLQQLALMFNTGVHVIMYYYYFLCAIGRPPRWKKTGD
eukprot:jgi/Botrbrau1/19466/Bobra.0338s0086.1